MKDMEKCKKEIRNIAKDSTVKKRTEACSENDQFRKKATGHIKFLENNSAKLESLLAGERDACPADLGKSIRG